MKSAFVGGIALGAAIGAAGQDVPYDRKAPIRKGLVPHACVSTVKAGYECGSFDVPLDYADESAGKATLEVVRFHATGSKKGTIMMNPGPGISGVDYILAGGLETYTGGEYDIVSWDPRGVGLTYPKIDCFASTTEDFEFWKGSAAHYGIEVHGNFTNTDATDPDVVAFWAEEPILDKLYTEFGQRCLEKNGDNLRYVGTAATVRDMVALADHLEGPDKLINYWGFSYGTVVGNYFVNMFPDRVGRVILDGVVNTLVWSQQPAHEIWAHNLIDIDALYAGFAESCAAAGPRGCAISSSGSTGASIVQWTKDLMDTAYDFNKAGGEYSSGYIRSQIFAAMYAPTGWPALAKQLYDIASTVYGKPTTGTAARRGLTARASDPLTYDAAIIAITCADSVDAGSTTTKDIFDNIIEVSRDVSQMFAPSLGLAGFYCHKWPARAPERFQGPFNRIPATKIVVIGNEADPITPFNGAQVVSDQYGENAILVKQDDYGHCSLAAHSTCTVSIIKAFWEGGAYPKDEQFCATNQILFPGGAITKEKLAGVEADVSLDPNVAVPGNRLNVLSTSETKELEEEVAELKSLKRTLLICVGALGAAFLLALVALLVALVRGKKSRAQYKPTATNSNTGMLPPRESMDALKYNDPYEAPHLSYADGGKGYTGHQ